MSAVRAVLLIGSPRGDGSASKALGDRLVRALAARGTEIDSHSLHAAHGSAAKTEAWLAAAAAADMVLVSFPLYVDQLPAPVILALDRLAERRRGADAKPGARLAALIQCGFPESSQNRDALRIMENYARTTGFRWAGGLSLGMGGALTSQKMPDKPAGLLRNVAAALDEAAEALAGGGTIPEAALARFARPLMPKRLYFMAANWGWKSQARKNRRKLGREIDLRAQPY